MAVLHTGRHLLKTGKTGSSGPDQCGQGLAGRNTQPGRGRGTWLPPVGELSKGMGAQDKRPESLLGKSKGRSQAMRKRLCG